MSNFTDYIEGKDLIAYADAYAEEKHEGQQRRGGDPYITHPREVANIISSITNNPDMIAAALLHDVLEDTNTTESEMKSIFGPTITSLVVELTNDPAADNNPDKSVKDNYLIKKMNRMSEEAFTIKLADRLHNVNSAITTKHAQRTLYILSQLNRPITAQQQKLIEEITKLCQQQLK